MADRSPFLFLLIVATAVLGLLLFAGRSFETAGDPDLDSKIVESDLMGSMKAESDFDDRSVSASRLDGAKDEDRLLNAIQHGSDVIEALQLTAETADWEERDLIAQLSYWGRLCEVVRFPERSPLPGSGAVPATFLDGASDFCASYTGDVSDFLRELIDEVSDMSSLEWLVAAQSRKLRELVDQGKVDAAHEYAFLEISRALDAMRFDLVEELLLNMHWASVLEPLPDSPRAEVRVQSMNDMPVIAVGTVLMCERIGGCRRNHPLVINFCLQMVARACEPPVDIYDAIDQVLTGYEIEFFNHMLRQIADGLRVVGHG